MRLLQAAHPALAPRLVAEVAHRINQQPAGNERVGAFVATITASDGSAGAAARAFELMQSYRDADIAHEILSRRDQAAALADLRAGRDPDNVARTPVRGTEPGGVRDLLERFSNALTPRPRNMHELANANADRFEGATGRLIDDRNGKSAEGRTLRDQVADSYDAEASLEVGKEQGVMDESAHTFFDHE